MTAGTPVERILLVDDDVALATMLREFFELQGFEVEMVHDGSAALDRVAQAVPALIVLDVMMPGISGFEVLKRLRERHQQVPVIMLSARGEESERILGLLGGADDYLPKPCNPLELVARVRAVLKRAHGRPPSDPLDEAITAGPLHLDMRSRTLHARGTEVQVTAAEMRLIEQLMRHAGEVMSRAQLTQLALDRPLEAYDRSVDTLISKLRAKLSAAGVQGSCIRSLRGHGYVLDLPPDAPGARPR